MCKNPAHHERTKHIDIKLHFIINEVCKGTIKMIKVHTNENPTDMLTKVVSIAKFRMCLNLTGLSNFLAWFRLEKVTKGGSFDSRWRSVD